MLAIAFFLGILTSGYKDEMPAVSTALENETVNSNNSSSGVLLYISIVFYLVN
jgi:hypothetical protein